MGLKKIPTRTDDSLGRVKYDEAPPKDLERELPAGEYNRLADAVIAVSEAVGLEDGSTEGSLEARMQDVAGRLDSAEGDIEALEAIDAEARLTALEAIDAEARLTALEAIDAEARLTALEGVDAGARLDALEEKQARILRARCVWDSEESKYEVEDAEGVSGVTWDQDMQRAVVEFDPGLRSQQLFVDVLDPDFGEDSLSVARAVGWGPGEVSLQFFRATGSGVGRVDRMGFDILIFAAPVETP